MNSMKRYAVLLLAVLTLTSTLASPALASEPPEKAEAIQEETTAPEDAGTEQGSDSADPEEAQPEPDPEGTVSWANLDSRIRAGRRGKRGRRPPPSRSPTRRGR